VKSLALVLVLALAPSEADAKCAPSSLQAAIATPAATVVPEGGGIVVAADVFFDGGNVADGDVSIQKGWKFRAGKLLVEATIDVIAPGLAVYRFPAMKDKVELEDDKHAVVATVMMTKDRVAVLDAPKLKKVVATKSLGRKGSTSVEVVLDGAVPATAVAIVAVDAKGKPITFGRVTQGEPLLVFARARCEVLTDGTVEPKAGEKITVFWLDAMGRMSPASKPIAITGAKTKVVQ